LPYKERECLALAIFVGRNPNNGRFDFEATRNTNHAGWEPDFNRDGSATRFAASFDAWLNKAVDHFRAYVTEYWDGVLEREPVEVRELAQAYEDARWDS
jgi:hypothetical protein